jgi:RNA polymerase sigma-70 factor (ECF subfamily)
LLKNIHLLKFLIQKRKSFILNIILVFILLQSTRLKNIEELVSKAQTGDTAAFGEVYDLVLTPIYRYIYAKVPQEIAEDLTEETFFKAWKSLAKYKKQKGCVFTSWLFRIAHNVVIDYYRQNQEIEELSLDISDEDVCNKPTVPIELELNSNLVKKFIGKLSHTLQQAIILRFVNDLKYSEIARIMKKNEGTVRVLIHRALHQLREMMRTEGFNE